MHKVCKMIEHASLLTCTTTQSKETKINVYERYVNNYSNIGIANIIHTIVQAKGIHKVCKMIANASL